MTDWTSGYVTDINYTYGYYPELLPTRALLALLNARIVTPKIEHACELGFGQGISINLHAAATNIHWHGTDFNPAQAGFAQQLAQVAGSGAQLFDQSFAEFCNRSDLPEFDYIGLHGIWSWISDENRSVIVDFLHRKLKTGGVLYISYNTQPGWAGMVPLRELLIEHAEKMGTQGIGMAGRVEAALVFAEKLMGVHPGYAREYPQVVERVKKLTDLNRNYLAHEYFNRDWQPMSFSAMAKWLAPAKLQFACSAHFQDHVASINLTDEQRTLLKEITDPIFQQVIRDFCTNQQFRRDYWIKGVRSLNSLEQTEQLHELSVVLVQPRVGIEPKISGSLGEATLQQAIYNPLFDMLADNKPKKIGQIAAEAKQQQIAFAQILQAIILLCGSGSLQVAQDQTAIQKVAKRTNQLNEYLMQKARGSADISYLVSPVTGGGISVPRFYQLFLLAYQQRKQAKSLSTSELAQFAWTVLSSQGQRLAKEGKALETAEANLAELTSVAEKFLDKHLSVYQALQII